MEDLNIIYTGAYANDIYTAYFDGIKWNGNTKISTQAGNISVRSATAPAAVTFNNWLYLVYMSADNNDLYCAWFDGAKWNGGVAIKTMNGGISPQSIASPTMVSYKGLLYIVYLTPGSADLYSAWFDGTTWFGNTKISHQMGGISPQTTINPALTVYNGNIYIIYTGRYSSTLYVAWFNGIQWSGNVTISSMPGGISPASSFTPGSGVFGGLLYLAYIGSWTNNIGTCTFDGTTWRGNTRISDQPGSISPSSSYCPALGVYKNNLQLIYTGSTFDNDLYSCYFDGTTWYGNTSIKNQPGGISPESSRNPQANLILTPPGTQAQWLERLPDTILLGDINLPGSHDAAAINSSFSTPYATQNYTITQQLEYGIRILDVRLKIKMSGATFSFATCHGDIGTNEYQSFPSLMDECKAFLQSNPEETVLMSLKVDDWSNSGNNKSQAFAALKTLLNAYPVTSSSYLQTLGAVRGKITLLNRLNDDLSYGVPISWPDNTKGSNANSSVNRAYTVYVQDQYQGLPLVGSEAAKLAVVTAAFSQWATGKVVLNFASATWFGVIGVYIQDRLLNFFGQNIAASRPAKFGWIMLDYGSTGYNTDTYSILDIVSIIIDSNFSYTTYPKKFKVVDDGKGL